MKAGDPILIAEPFCPLPEDDGVARWHESEYSQVPVNECCPHPGVPIGELVAAVREWKREVDGSNPSNCAGEDRLYDLAARMEAKP